MKASNLLYLTWGLTQQTRLGNLVLLYSTLYKLIYMIDLIIFGGNGLGKSSIPSSPLLELRHSFTSRFLFTCISSRLFDGEKTLQDLNAEWAKQLRTLFYEGVKAVYLKYIYVVLKPTFSPPTYPATTNPFACRWATTQCA